MAMMGHTPSVRWQSADLIVYATLRRILQATLLLAFHHQLLVLLTHCLLLPTRQALQHSTSWSMPTKPLLHHDEKEIGMPPILHLLATATEGAAARTPPLYFPFLMMMNSPIQYQATAMPEHGRTLLLRHPRIRHLLQCPTFLLRHSCKKFSLAVELPV